YGSIRSQIDVRQVGALVVLIRFLNQCRSDDLPVAYRRTDFFDAYCEDGANSRFVSSRGSEGNRRFFTPKNASRIDDVLNRLRFWNLEGITGPEELAILLAVTLRAVERVANTQGTFHDF